MITFSKSSDIGFRESRTRTFTAVPAVKTSVSPSETASTRWPSTLAINGFRELSSPGERMRWEASGPTKTTSRGQTSGSTIESASRMNELSNYFLYFSESFFRDDLE